MDGERHHNLVETRITDDGLVAMCACSWQSDPTSSGESAKVAFQGHITEAAQAVGTAQPDPF